METFLHRKSQFHSVHISVKANKFHRKMHQLSHLANSVCSDFCTCLNLCLSLYLNKAIPSVSKVYWRTIQNTTEFALVQSRLLSQVTSPSHLPSACSHTDYLVVRMKTTHCITSTNLVKAKASSQAVAKIRSLRTENFGDRLFLWLSSLF